MLQAENVPPLLLYILDYYINLRKIEQTSEGQWTCQQAGKTIKTIQLSVDGN